MSLAIDVDKVKAVLLADGWHQVAKTEGTSTFKIDAYEFVSGDGGTRLSIGQGERASVAGATWIEPDGKISCPLTSVLAVRC
jgi:hypothetical protein